MRLLSARLSCTLAIACSATACNGGVPSSSASTAVTPSSNVTPAAAPASPSAVAPPLSGQIVFFDFAVAPGFAQIYIENADGSNVRRVVTSQFNDEKPALSPDGHRIAFTRYVPDGAPLKDGGVFIVNVDGSGLKQIDTQSEDVAWSPDGSKLVMTRALFDPAAQSPYNVALWIVNADGTDLHQISLKGRRCENACANGAQDNQAVWSPDGKRLAFKRDTYTKPERFSIFSMAIDGSDLRRVTPEGMDVGDPDWSPDGTRIAVQAPPEANEGGQQNIYTIKSDGTDIRQLTADLSSSNGRMGTFHPSWSPDGQQIAFSHDPGMGGVSDIFVMNADGSGLRVLAATPLNENAPDWGPTPTT
jgi:Tol biopolymer transport system component